MNEKTFDKGSDALRNAERLKRLEVKRVTDLCLENLSAKSVLDIGSGSAVFAESFASRGLHVGGIDVNPEMIAAARRYVPNGDFRLGAAESIPFPGKSFDVAFLGLVLHESDDQIRALTETKRVACQRVAVLEWPYIEEEKGPPLSHRLTKEEIVSMSRLAGLTKIDVIQLDHLLLFRMQVV